MSCNITETLRAKGFNGDVLGAEVAKYKKAIEAQDQFYDSRDKLMEEHLTELLAKPFRIYYKSTTTKESKSEVVELKLAEHDSRAGVTKIVLTDGKQYKFDNGVAESRETKKGSHITSTTIEGALKAVLIRNTLHNKELTEEEIALLFLNTDTTSDTIINIQKQLQIIDRKALGVHYDAKHSELLETVVERIMDVSKTIRDLKISTSKDVVEGLHEPVAEFDPTNIDNPITIIKSDLGQEARNKFTMTNEEAMTHELVHAALDWVFNNKLVGVLGEALKAHITRLYEQARDTMTWEDMLDDQVTYTLAEEKIAKDRFDYVFNRTQIEGVNTRRDAEVRLQEFMAHLMTNKAMQRGLNKLETKPYKAEIKVDENLLEMTMRKLFDWLSSMFHKTRKIKGKTVLEESVKVVFALTEIQDKYGKQAAGSRDVSFDEKITNGLNTVTTKIDSVAKPIVDFVAEKTLGVPKEAMTLEEFNGILKESNLNFPIRTDSTIVKLKKIMVLLPKIRLHLASEGKFGREDFSLFWSRLFNSIGLTEDSFIRQLVADFSAGRKTLEAITDSTMAFRYYLDRLREQNYEGTLKDVYNDMFIKVNLRLAENNRYDKALGEVTMITDLQSLVPEGVSMLDLDMKALVKSIKDPTKEIVEIEARLSKVDTAQKKGYDKDAQTSGQRFIQDAASAAQHMVTGIGLRTNAENISRMFGTAYNLPYGEHNLNEEHIADIDKLITLKALQLTEQVSKDTMIELIEKDESGVREYLRYSRGVQVALKEEFREAEPQNYMKGNVRETKNKNKDLQMAPMAERKELEAMGYKLVRKIESDKRDGDTKTTRILKDGVYTNKVTTTSYGLFLNESLLIDKRVDGGMGYEAGYVGGLTLMNKIRMSNPNMQDGRLHAKGFNAIKAAERVYRRTGNVGDMQPIFDSQGIITDFRYTTSRLDKQVLQELRTEGSEILAKSEGALGALEVTNINNASLLEYIFEDEASLNTSGHHATDNSHLYLNIKAKEIKLSENERKILYDGGQSELLNLGKYGLKTRGEEIWGMLPPATRKAIMEHNIEKDLAQLEIDILNPKSEAYTKANAKVLKDRKPLSRQKQDIKDYPRKELMIRKDLLNQLFGYQEASITDVKIFEKMSQSSRHRTKVVESYVKDIVAMLKSVVVVKLPATIWGNITSNARFLFYAGMSIKKAFTYLLSSMKHLGQWKKDDFKLEQIKRKMNGETGVRLKGLERDYADLQAKMETNPLAPLMKRGLYQSIVEDVVLHEENNKVAKLVEKFGPSKTKSPLLHELVHTVFLTNKSMAGRLMTRITQESDFHFRAATYWHGIEQGKTEEEMTREVIDNFINYSKVINNKSIQWLDRVGGQSFWKFTANIQRINLKIMKRNPSRVVLDKAEQYLFGNGSDIMDSNIFHAIGRRWNPYTMFTSLVDGGTEIPLYNAFAKGL